MKLFITIALILAITLSGICAVFYYKVGTNGAWASVLALSYLGSFTSIFIYLGDKEDKKTRRWED